MRNVVWEAEIFLVSGSPGVTAVFRALGLDARGSISSGGAAGALLRWSERALVYSALGGYLEAGVPQRQVEPHPKEAEKLRVGTKIKAPEIDQRWDEVDRWEVVYSTRWRHQGPHLLEWNLKSRPW